MEHKTETKEMENDSEEGGWEGKESHQMALEGEWMNEMKTNRGNIRWSVEKENQ